MIVHKYISLNFIYHYNEVHVLLNIIYRLSKLFLIQCINEKNESYINNVSINFYIKMIIIISIIKLYF